MSFTPPGLPGLADGGPDAAEKELAGGRIGGRAAGLGSAGRLMGGDGACVAAAPVGAEAGTKEAGLLWVHRPLRSVRLRSSAWRAAGKLLS
jgi:hypothetical protein